MLNALNVDSKLLILLLKYQLRCNKNKIFFAMHAMKISKIKILYLWMKNVAIIFALTVYN